MSRLLPPLRRVLTRASLLRRGAAEAGRGLPAIEPGMPMPAGTGLDRRSFVSRRPRPRALRLRARQAAAASRRASPRPPRAPRSPCSSRSSCRAAPTRCRCSTRRSTRTTGSCARRSRCPTRAGPAFTEDTRLHWHPTLQPLATLHGEGKVSVLPAVGYTHPDQSHFTSRHFWEVGATDARLASGWMGRYLDHDGDEGQPAAGALARLPAAAVARLDEGAGRLAGRARRVHLLGARRLGRGREPDARGARRARRAPLATRS